MEEVVGSSNFRGVLDRDAISSKHAEAVVWVVASPPPVSPRRPVTRLPRMLAFGDDSDVWIKVKEMMLLSTKYLVAVPRCQSHPRFFRSSSPYSVGDLSPTRKRVWGPPYAQSGA